MGALTKTSKVVSTSFKREWKNKQGGTNYTFSIAFENGDSGEFNTNQNPQVKFVEGETVTYTIEKVATQTSKGIWERIKIDKVREDSGRNYYSPDPNKQKRIVRSVALKAALKLKALTKDPTKLFELSDMIFDWVNEYGGADEGKNISAQTAVNALIMMLEDVEDPKDKEGYQDHDKLFKHIKLFADYITTNKDE